MICGIICCVLYMFMLSLKQLYMYLILCLRLHSLRKGRFRWFSEACIPRALALYILWRRVQTRITHSWWFSTSLVERAKCLKCYLHEASTSVLNTVNLPITAPDADFPKKPFQSNHWQSGFPQLGLQWLLLLWLTLKPALQFCGVFNISEARSSHLEGSWHTQNSHKP